MKLVHTTKRHSFPSVTFLWETHSPQALFPSTTQVVSDFQAPAFQEDLTLMTQGLKQVHFTIEILVPTPPQAKHGLAVIPSAPQPCVLEERQLEKKNAL